MYKPYVIANYFIEQRVRYLTPMKLTKLVYIAHGWHLAFTDQPLLTENIEAWKYGPVSPSVYYLSKEYGKHIVSNTLSYEDSKDLGDVKKLLDNIINTYDHLDGLQLSTLTHYKDTPWYDTWKEANRFRINSKQMDDDLIMRFYKKKDATEDFKMGL